MRVRWTTPARRDVIVAADFLRERNVGAPRTFSKRLNDQLRMLAEYPMAGPAGRQPGTRELIINRTRYVVVYRIANGEVHILRVLHSAQDWPPGSADAP